MKIFLTLRVCDISRYDVFQSYGYSAPKINQNIFPNFATLKKLYQNHCSNISEGESDPQICI